MGFGTTPSGRLDSLKGVMMQQFSPAVADETGKDFYRDAIQ
jgi:hypothetical protein